MSEEERPTCAVLFFDPCNEGVQLQNLVYLHYPQGECEEVQCSLYSPGPVGDDEVLTRLIVHPIHFDDDGKVSPLAFNDATTMDLSLFREGLAEDSEIQLAIDEIRKLGQSKVPPQNRLVQVVMQASAREIRDKTFESGGIWKFYIYDTGVAEKPAHASVFTPEVARKGAAQRKARKALLELFTKKTVIVDDYRNLNYCGVA